MRVEVPPVAGPISQAVGRRSGAPGEAPQSDSAPPGQAIRVTLSEQGRMAAQAARKNSDIDESELPAAIKDLLKRIRELKAELAERQAELRAAMADISLDDEARQLKVDALRDVIASLNGALTGFNAQLIMLMRDGGLTSEQLLSIAALSI